MKTNFNFDRNSLGSGSGAGIRLSEVLPGQAAIVLEVSGGGAERRLLDLGFFPKTHVRALRRAPLGDPLVFELRGYQLCIRRADAACIRVELEDPPGGSPHND